MEHTRAIQLDNLGGLKRGRFWYNHIPFMLGATAKRLNGSFYQPAVVASTAFKLCCEIALLPREISNYGLLGVEFSPSEGAAIEYEIFYFDRPGEVLKDNLASKSERVFVGMTGEFAISVKEEMERSIGSKIPNGKYSFVTSAHGVVGSSKAIFSKLTSILIKLAGNDPNSLDIEKMKLIIADEIKKG